MGTITLRISICILITIVLFCLWLSFKRWKSAKLQISICIFILIVCTIGVIYIPEEENMLINLCISLLASTISSIIYTNLSDINQKNTLDKIDDTIENQKSTLDTIGDNINNQKNALDTIKERLDCSINQLKTLDKIEEKLDNNINLDYFRADRLYKPNRSDEPDLELCNELSQMLSDSTVYIYEGEDATAASICMLLASEINKGNRKQLNAHFIIRDISKIRIERTNFTDDLKNSIRNIFTTIFLLHNIATKKNNITIKIYMRNSLASQYVNLTDKGVFFSPYKKTKDGYPKTCLFRKHDETKEDLYQLFDIAWNARINQLRSNSHDLTEAGILKKMKFRQFAQVGCFGDELVNIPINRISMDTEQIQNYFAKLINDRKSLYKIKN